LLVTDLTKDLTALLARQPHTDALLLTGDAGTVITG
jgi:hypothetical protein